MFSAVKTTPGNLRYLRRRFQEKCSELGIACHRLAKYSIENYFSLRALREVFGSQIPPTITELLPNQRVEDQLGMNVKKSNRAIAREMSLEELEGTDLKDFLISVECTLRSEST